jgi:hypothetical protein
METPPSQSDVYASVSPLLASRDWKERRKCIKYEGDPDLQPIKSTENAFLVRLLCDITSKLNEMVSDSSHIIFGYEFIKPVKVINHIN